MKALVIPASINENMRLINIGKDPLRTFYKAIGCRLIDVITLTYLNRGHYLALDAVVDDEGLLNDSPINERFILAYKARRICSPIFGTVVIVMTDEASGETVDLEFETVKNILINKFEFLPAFFKDLKP